MLFPVTGPTPALSSNRRSRSPIALSPGLAGGGDGVMTHRAAPWTVRPTAASVSAPAGATAADTVAGLSMRVAAQRYQASVFLGLATPFLLVDA